MFCLFVINGKAWSDPRSSTRAGLLGRSPRPSLILLTACPLQPAPGPLVRPLALTACTALRDPICLLTSYWEGALSQLDEPWVYWPQPHCVLGDPGPGIHLTRPLAANRRTSQVLPTLSARMSASLLTLLNFLSACAHPRCQSLLILCRGQGGAGLVSMCTPAQRAYLPSPMSHSQQTRPTAADRKGQ